MANEGLRGRIGANVQVTGFEQVLGRLSRLKQAVQNRILRKAVNAASSITLKAVKAKAKAIKDSGLLWKSLGRKVKTYKNGGTTVAIIGPRSGFGQVVTTRDGKKQYRDPLFYSHLVEFGTRPHSLGKGSKLARLKNGKLVGRQSQFGAMHPGSPPQPFLRPGWDESKAAAEAAAIAVLAAELAKAGV